MKTLKFRPTSARLKTREGKIAHPDFFAKNRYKEAKELLKKKNTMDGFSAARISADIVAGSRADTHWRATDYAHYWHKLREPRLNEKELGKLEIVSPDSLQKSFGIKQFGWGNWVTLEDRQNYLAALHIALEDLNKVLKFNNNIGIGNNLTVTFGARGIPKANAHYEPTNELINLARYHRDADGSKFDKMIQSGGIGSLAHEYGHFLDFFAGKFLEKNIKEYSITGGISTRKDRLEVSGKMRTLADDILEKIIWSKPNEVHSKYYERLLVFLKKNNSTSDYYLRRAEIWARAFEVFVFWELKKQEIENFLLVKSKIAYPSSVYLNEAEMKKIAPLFKKFLAEFKKKTINK
ncbi:hypothetical protein SAMN05421780_11031 [Flexibacter flexilis DSM 6793]|uniref:Large polyvalent protein-associated domain-containing protein n=1 Tax=Flexibacter flexilis DSM 6793 TaxID=927664 RepID=A0A1I1M4V1_9BACT|nr:LPD1 domain-containing protein [Flexibacter flexilis]SFC80394.1 hypothetical protein SAMN05421780_11031 [Flexibacter flexilis DSM 6793]